jgi:RNA binding exosome subunit
MSSIPLHYVDLRTFCYVTEDEKRVEEALRTLLPEEFEIDRTESEGHHGDRIVVLSARVENADEMRTVLDQLGTLPDGARETILDELDERVNENCTFFLTLDKQAAFKGDVRPGDGITVRAKVEAYPANKEAAVENISELLEEL